MPWITCVQLYIAEDTRLSIDNLMKNFSVYQDLVDVTSTFPDLSYLNLDKSVYRYWLACPAVVWIPIDVRANEEWFCLFIPQALMHPYSRNTWSRWMNIVPSGKMKNIVPPRGEFICSEGEWNTIFFFDCQSWSDKFSSHSLKFAYIWKVVENDVIYRYNLENERFNHTPASSIVCHETTDL